VDVSDHAGTQPEITKGTRKKMPVGDPEASVEPELVLSNPGGKEKKKKRERDREDEEPPSGDKKKKKRKKGKTSGATSDSPTAYATDSFLEVAGTSEATGTTVAVKEKKKRKKIKSSAEASDDVDVNVEAEPLSKPKSRKRKKEATAEDEGHTSTTAPVEDSSRKRKRSKKSIHSNPSDDSDLTEQSQKGSHSFPILKYQTLTLSFDRGSFDLHLLPIHLTRQLEIQQSSSKLDNPQHLDLQGEERRMGNPSRVF